MRGKTGGRRPAIRRSSEHAGTDLATFLRCALTLVTLVAAFSEGSASRALPWVLGILLIELVGTGARTPADRLQVLVGQTVIAAGAVAVTLPEHRALLPLLLVPAFRAGQLHGMRVAVLTGSLLALAPLVTVVAAPGTSGLVSAVQWAALALALAMLGAWNAGLDRDRREPAAAMAREAGALLGRLQDLARALPAGFDVPAVAELLVDDVLAAAPAERAAVLVRIGPNEVSPVVVRGVERVPWRDPVNSPGTANTAWVQRRTVHDLRLPEQNGRRKGSAMLAVPIADRDDELLGLLVLQRSTPRPFTRTEVERVEAAVHRSASRLHAALAFVELRSLSEVAERERLARDMHDGVAQDLVVVGFGIDAVKRQLRDRDEALAAQLGEVRSHLNDTIRDIRYSIADLRSSVRSDRGLGAALSSAAQSLGPATGAEVTFSLRESAFRLPAHVESAFLRLAQDFFACVRGGETVSVVDILLETAPPLARLELRHDGVRPWEPEPLLAAALRELGGSVHTFRDSGRWVSMLALAPRTGAPAGPARVSATADVDVRGTAEAVTA